MEEWKSVVGYEGYYEVSNLGRVRTDLNAKAKGFHFQAGKILKQHGECRYFRVALCGPKKIFRTVHTLVLTAFIGPRPDGCESRHLDGNSFNNAVTNLAWSTHQENIEDKKKHGTQTRGSRHGPSKLTESDVMQIRKLRSDGLTFREISNRFPVCSQTAHCIVSRKTWAHV